MDGTAPRGTDDGEAGLRRDGSSHMESRGNCSLGGMVVPSEDRRIDDARGVRAEEEGDGRGGDGRRHCQGPCRLGSLFHKISHTIICAQFKM